MAIPDFTVHGLLPEGIHECTLNEICARFGSDNPSHRRAQLCLSLVDFEARMRATDCFTRLYVGGSFVTSKEEPGDVDLVLELPPPTQTVARKLVELRLFDRSYLKEQFNLHVHLYFQNESRYDFRALFQYLRPEEASTRGLIPGDTKGILKVSL